MNTSFRHGQLELTLHRWPLDQPNHSLQAWDAADELLLQHALPLLAQLQQANRSPAVLIINDSFGALSCAVGNSRQYWLQDSYLAQLACRYNRSANDLSLATFTELTSLDPLPEQFDLVLMKLPVNHSYLSWQLQALSQRMTKDTLFCVAAKVKDIQPRVLELFNRYIGPTHASLAERKCRLIHSQYDPEFVRPALDYPLHWSLPEHDFTLINHANVFSREKPDIGARFFLSQLPKVSNGQRVIDLGCGNGMLSLGILSQQTPVDLLLTDESYMAVASAKLTIAANFAAQLPQCQFNVDDCLSRQPDNSADWIICNPPFHQNAAVTTHIASQMFYDAKRVLKPGGKLRIVANRHLPYRQQLALCFGSCRQIAANPKFVILESTKRNT